VITVIRRVFLLFSLLILIGTPPPKVYSQPQVIKIICKRSLYEPETIRIQGNQPVRILLKSDDVTHGFALDEFNIAKEVPPGPPTIVEFTPDKSGTFEFYCVVRCGKDHLKMRGNLIVE
jgi:heme/copper-type cytochrome/quinol oxidase subunit 2